MSISVRCEECGKTLKAPDSAAGKKAKCPQCGAVVAIPEPVFDAEEVSEAEPVDDDSNAFGDADSYDSPADESDERKPCPACGEMIVARAAKCRYCGEIFDKKLKRSGKSSSRSRGGSSTLAGPGKRLLGALADGFVSMLFLAPGFVSFGAAGGFGDDPRALQGSVAIAGLIMMVVGGLALFVLQIYLLATCSQSIGKYLVKTQIMDYETDAPANFVKCFLMRGVVNGIIGAVPCVGPIYGLVDPLFVFSEEHRCLHDLLAGTYVVDIS